MTSTKKNYFDKTTLFFILPAKQQKFSKNKKVSIPVNIFLPEINLKNRQVNFILWDTFIENTFTFNTLKP